MNTVFAAIGRFCVRFRWVLLAAWLAGIVASMAFLPSLSSVTQGDNTGFLPPSAPSQRAIQLATPLQKAGLTAVTVVLYRPEGSLTAADQAAIARLKQSLAGIPLVSTVRDAGESADGHAEQVIVLAKLSTSGGQAVQQQTTLTGQARAAIRQMQAPPGLQGHLAGPVATRVDNNNQSRNTGASVQSFSILFVIVLLALIFRSVLAPLIAVIPSILVVLTAERLTAEVAVHGLQVSQLASLLLIVLVIGAGTDYALFLMFRVREEIRRGLSPKEAVATAVARVGESITFSAGTVIAALLSLLAATFSLYSGLGIPLAIGIGLMLVAGLTLLPALLAILEEAAFWPANVTPGALRAGWWGRISGRIVHRPVVTLVAGLVVFGGLAAVSVGYAAGGFGGAATAPAGSDSATGNTLLAAHFPETSANPTVIVMRLPRPLWDSPQAVAAAQQQLAASHEFSRVAGPLNPNGTALTPSQYTKLHAALGPPAGLSGTRTVPDTPGGGQATGRSSPAPGAVRAYQAYRASGQLVSQDGRTIEFVTGLAAGDPTSTAAEQAVPAVRSAAGAAARTAGATANGVLGQAAGTYDVASLSDSDLRTVIPIAIAVIAILLALVMRSLVAPLYLIASVALSYFAALGLTVLLFMKVGSQTGLTFILPFLMFVFLLALGEDYNILVMTRIREEARTLRLREAVTRALSMTGSTITSAGLVLAGTFGVLALAGAGAGANGSTFVSIGAGLGLGVLMDTFLVRTLLVPSTVVILGRWNWWPSRLGSTSPATAGTSTAGTSSGETSTAGTAGDVTPAEGATGKGSGRAPSVPPPAGTTQQPAEGAELARDRRSR